MWRITIAVIGFLLITCSGVTAQARLQIQGSTPELYLNHKVAARENWYSIGRQYNLSPKVVAAYNQLSLDHMLSKATQIRIPLTAQNFSQDGTKMADEVFVPVYHQSGDREWMYRISIKYNKVPVASLENWNRIKNNQLQAGLWLVVGYLKVKTALSPLAAKGLHTLTTPDLPAALPVTNNRENKAPIASSTAAPAVPVIAEDRKAVSPEARPTAPATPLPPPTSVNHSGGVFKKSYADNGTLVSGNAGVFRSTSGWNDGKYYALMNEVPVGTIVKVTFTSTNKHIFAKVLGRLPEMKENAGLSLRISDAAAAELETATPKFYVDVHF